jgi:predicted Zn-dependent protease
MRPVRLGLSAALAFAAAACGGATRSAVVAPPTSAERTEVSWGRIADDLRHACTSPYSNAELGRYVQSVGQRIAAHSERPALPWRFVVLDSPVATAYAFPGGLVAVTRGALAAFGSEAELASVLAHEVAHVAYRHSSSWWHSGVPVATAADDAEERAARREEDQERQADALAVRYLEAAGYDGRALGRALVAIERVAPQQADSAADEKRDPHPPLAARLARVAALVRSGGDIGRERYLDRIAGLEIGAGSHAVHVSDGRLVAPGELSFAIPPVYRSELGPSGIAIFSDAKSGGTRLVVGRIRGGIWREFLRNAFKQVPYTASEVLGHLALTTVIETDGDEQRVVAAMIETPASVFLLGIKDDERAARATMGRIVRSMRREGESRRTRVLRIERADAPESFGELVARRCPGMTRAEAYALNGLQPNARLTRGEHVKCVAVVPPGQTP